MTLAYAPPYPMIIQGGMGIGVSNWVLARAVSLRGQLGVVSGTCIDTVLVRRLQDGDPGGHMRRAIERFPIPEIGTEVLKKYFLPEGRPEGAPYALLSMWQQTVSRARQQITMLASFVEVHLAKEGHDGAVGINLLTKVQMPNLATLYGAMLAGVDYVLMGAGIPKEIPGVLDAFAEQRPASIRLDVEGLDRNTRADLTFDPREHVPADAPGLPRPKFLPIVSSHSLATMLARKSNGRVDGFIVEGPTAGGHNAPPRGRHETNGNGEPVYGPRDQADLAEMRDLGLPFWLAGGSGSPEQLRYALDEGAAGIQVGTLFAYTEESGLADDIRKQVRRSVCAGTIDVKTDGRASPTGFPFKVVNLAGTNAYEAEYQQRKRVCDLGYLRTAYQRPDGRISYRCPAEPVNTYIKKDGAEADTSGRKCLCNALMANIGHAQQRVDGPERALLTSGDCLTSMPSFAANPEGYSADDVIDYLLTGLNTDGRMA